MADGDWIEHDGNGCPVPCGTAVEVVYESLPGEFHGPVSAIASKQGLSWHWLYWRAIMDGGFVARIIRYRVRRPRALEQLREIAENPTAPLPKRRPSREFA